MHDGDSAESAIGVLRALTLVRTGQLLDLSTPVSPTTPRFPGLLPYEVREWIDPRESRHRLERAEGAENGIGFADERVEMDLHTGTHIDALGHTWVRDAGFGGVAIEDGVGADSLRRLGAEEIPALVGRGVLLDVAADDELEGGEPIGAERLRAAAERDGIELQAGDQVLIRTGWGAVGASDPERYAASWPGIDIEAARWLTSHFPVLVGADNLALEVYPEQRRGEASPVHAHLLVETGIFIVEQADLEELAASGRREFLCLCLPVRYVGATASPVRLAALL